MHRADEKCIMRYQPENKESNYLGNLILDVVK
jgi:hypothetical protein